MSERFTLHGNAMSGPTYKVALMLALSGKSFAYRHVNLRELAQKKPEYLALNRFGQVPTLVDNSDNRRFVQSAVILEVLADRIGTFGGADRWERIEAREWLFWEFDRLAPPIYRSRTIRLGIRQAHDATKEMYTTEGAVALAVLDQHLAGRDWIVGAAPTIADIDIYGVLAYAAAGGFNLADYPSITTFITRLQSLPGFASPETLLPKEDRD